MLDEKSWSAPAWMRGSGYNINLGDGYCLVGGLPNMDYYEDYYQSCGTGTVKVLKDGKEYITIIVGNINCRGDGYRIVNGKDKLIRFGFSAIESNEQCYTILKSDGKSTYKMCGASGWVIYKISITFKTSESSQRPTTTSNILTDEKIVGGSKEVFELKNGKNIINIKRPLSYVRFEISGYNKCGYPSCISIKIDNEISGFIKCHYGGWSDAIIPPHNWTKQFENVLKLERPKFHYTDCDLRKILTPGQHIIEFPDECQQKNLKATLTVIYASISMYEKMNRMSDAVIESKNEAKVEERVKPSKTSQEVGEKTKKEKEKPKDKSHLNKYFFYGFIIVMIIVSIYFLKKSKTVSK